MLGRPSAIRSSALTASKLKSTLDQSFAQVNLSQAQLLQPQRAESVRFCDGQPQRSSGYHRRHAIQPGRRPVSARAGGNDLLRRVITLALQQRPDLLALKLTHDADLRFARAQRDQLLPTISGLGVVGATPWHPNTTTTTYFLEPWYGAAGVNIQIPIFNGFKFHSEAERGRFTRQGLRRAEPCSDRPYRARRAHRLADDEYSSAANDSYDRAAERRPTPRSTWRTQISPGFELHRGVEPGPVTTNTGAD